MKFRECLMLGVIAALLALRFLPGTPGPADPNLPAPVLPAPDAPAVPDGVPVSFDGFHAVIVRESGAPPLWLVDLVASHELRAYLDGHCEGGKLGWRQWDQHAPLANAPPILRELMQVPRPGVPCLVVGARKKAAAIALDQASSPAKVLEALKPWGGP